MLKDEIKKKTIKKNLSQPELMYQTRELSYKIGITQ
jgi:hypothetical protein